jgi:uncharacterized membrane protein YheB (UPF0754 family)
MNCVDEHVMKQIYVEADKAYKHLYNDEQFHQIIDNLVESRIKRHIIDKAHELVLAGITERINIELKNVIHELDLKEVVRHKAITYFHSEDFSDRLKSILEYSDIHYLDKEITLKEIQDALSATNG